MKKLTVFICTGVITASLLAGCGSTATSAAKSSSATSTASVETSAADKKGKTDTVTSSATKSADKKTSEQAKTKATQTPTATPTKSAKKTVTPTPTAAATQTPTATPTQAETETASQTVQQSQDTQYYEDTETTYEDSQQNQPNQESSSGEQSSVDASSRDTSASTSDHVHDWQPKISVIAHHPAVTHQEDQGHYEYEMISEEYDEHEYEYRSICNGCGMDLTIASLDNGFQETDHILNCGPGSWTVKYVPISTIHHDAVYDYVWYPNIVTVVDQEAYDETAITCYICSICGRSNYYLGISMSECQQYRPKKQYHAYNNANFKIILSCRKRIFFTK